MRAVICFLRAKIMSAAENRCELCAIYGQNVMSEGTVKQWCSKIGEKMFKIKSEVVGHL
jgi:hypothetical protein